MWAPSIPSSIPQIVICTLLLCLQIGSSPFSLVCGTCVFEPALTDASAFVSPTGPSALAGIAFFFVIIPLQSWTMQLSIKVRMNSMTYVSSLSLSSEPSNPARIRVAFSSLNNKAEFNPFPSLSRPINAPKSFRSFSEPCESSSTSPSSDRTRRRSTICELLSF